MAQIADDGFIYVERKRPARKQRKGKQPMALSLVQRMEDLSLARKAFAVACQDQLQSVLKGRDPLRCAICIALGQLTDVPAAPRSREQLVVLTALLAVLQTTQPVELYDPAFQASDLDYLTSQGWRPSASPARLSPFDAPTFLFMPHCPRSVYEDVLRANWSPDGLARLVILGNRLQTYVDDEVRKTKRDRYPCILRIAPHVQVEDLPPLPDDVDPAAFHAIAFQWFETSTTAVLAADEAFWTLPPGVDHAESDEDRV